MYLKLFMPDHPRSDPFGFLAVHVLVAEQELGRALKKGEDVHHKNFCPVDNRPENLWVMEKALHRRIPLLQARFIQTRGLYTSFYNYALDETLDPMIKAAELLAPIIQKEIRLNAPKIKPRFKAKEASDGQNRDSTDQ